MTKRVYWRQISLSSFRYAGPYFYQTQEDMNALRGPFWGYWLRKQKNSKGVGGTCCVFLHCEQMRSNPVLVFEVVVGFVSLFSHLILNILNMREWSGRWALPPSTLPLTQAPLWEAPPPCHAHHQACSGFEWRMPWGTRVCCPPPSQLAPLSHGLGVWNRKNTQYVSLY